MFFNKKKTEVDDDFDDLDNFDDFDLEEGGFNDATPETGPRKVINDIKGGFVKGLRDNLLDPTTHRKILKETMPDGYIAHYDDVRTLIKESRSLYNTARKEGSKVHKEFARELAPAVDKWNEEKDSKMSRALARAVKVQETDSGMSENEVSDEELALQQHQAEVFGNAMAQETAEGVGELTANTETNAEIQRGLGEKNNELLLEANNSLNQQNAFNEQVALKWKKTTLEIQFRQYFTARKQLEILKQNHEYMQATLPNIVKNTSLPDAVKIQTTELAMQSFSQKIFGNLTDKATSSFGDIVSKFGSNLKDSGIQLAEQLASYSPMVGTALGMFNNDSGFGTTPQQIFAEFIGGLLSTELTNFAINKSKNALTDLAGSEHLDLEHKGNKAQFLKDNLPTILDNVAQNGTGIDIVDKILRAGGAEMLVSSRDNILQYNLEDNLEEVALFNIETQRSITTTIPSLLSEIHSEIRTIRTGWDFEVPDAKEKLRMDWSSGQLNTTGNIQRRISNELYGKSRQEAVSNITYDMLESLGFDRNQLNTEGNILDKEGNEILSRRDVNFLSIAIKTISYQKKAVLDLQEFAIGSPYITDERARFNVAKFFTEHLDVEDHGVEIKGAYNQLEAQARLADMMSSQEFKVARAMKKARDEHNAAGIDESKWRRLTGAGYGDIFNKMGVTGRDEKGNLIYDEQADMERLFKDKLVKVTDPERLWRDQLNDKFGAQSRANRGHEERVAKAEKERKEKEEKEAERKARNKARLEGDRKGLRGLLLDVQDGVKEVRTYGEKTSKQIEEVRNSVFGNPEENQDSTQNTETPQDEPQRSGIIDGAKIKARKAQQQLKEKALKEWERRNKGARDYIAAMPGNVRLVEDQLGRFLDDPKENLVELYTLINDKIREQVEATSPNRPIEPDPPVSTESPIAPRPGPVVISEGSIFSPAPKKETNFRVLMRQKQKEKQQEQEFRYDQLSDAEFQPIVDEIAKIVIGRGAYTKLAQTASANLNFKDDEPETFFKGGQVTAKSGLFRNFAKGGKINLNPSQVSYIEKVSNRLLKNYADKYYPNDHTPWYQGGTLGKIIDDVTPRQETRLITSLRAAVDKERQMGGEPQVIVASEGEEVLPTHNGDADFFRRLKDSGLWEKLKTTKEPNVVADTKESEITGLLKQLGTDIKAIAEENKTALLDRKDLLGRDLKEAWSDATVDSKPIQGIKDKALSMSDAVSKNEFVNKTKGKAVVLKDKVSENLTAQNVKDKAESLKDEVTARSSNAFESSKQWFNERDFSLSGVKIPALSLQQKPLSIISHQMAELIRLSGHVAINTGSEVSDIEAPNPDELVPFKAGKFEIKARVGSVGAWFKDRFKRKERTEKDDDELSESRIGSVWSKISARFKRATDEGETLSEEETEEIKEEVKRLLDDPEINPKQKKSLLRRIAGLPWAGVKLGTRLSWSATKLSTKASWFMGSKTAKAGWWTGSKITKGLFGSKGGSTDVYLMGLDDPIILARDLKAGRYLSVADGKPVLTTDDIKGPLIDEQGNMPFTMKDFTEGRVVVRTTEGTRSLFVKGMVLAGRGIKGGLGLSFNMTRWSTKLAWNIAKLPFSIATMKMDKKIEADNPETILKDIYVKGGGEPRIQAALVDKPAYFNSKKEPVTKYSQLNEPVYDEQGNLVISTLDIRKGLVTPDGILITKVFKMAGRAIGAVASAGWRTGVAMTKLSGRILAGSFKMVTGAGRGLWNMLRGRGLFDGTGNSDYYEMMIQAQAASVDKLEMIRIILDERLEEKKKKFNDKDGDGHRDGSFLSQLRRKQEEAKNKKAKPEKEKKDDKDGLLKGLASAVSAGMTTFFTRGALMAALGGVMAAKFGPQIAGGIFGGIRSVLPWWLGGYSDEKKAAIKNSGGALAHVMRGGLMPDEQRRAQARGDGTGDGSHFDENGFPISGGPNDEGGMSTATKFALGAAALYLGPGRIVKGVGAGAKGIGKGAQWLSNKTGLTGRLGMSGMGKWAATKHIAKGIGRGAMGAGRLALTGGRMALQALPLLTSTPVGWGILAAVAVAAVTYGGYKLYKHLKNSNNHLATWRMGQYGFKISNSKVVTKILDLEDYLGKHVIEARKNTPARLSEQADPKEALRIMGISEKDEEAKEKFFHWFFYRFKPVFLSWKTLANTIARQTDLHTLDDRLLKSEKLEIVDKTNFIRQDQNPYDMMVSPVPGKDHVTYDHEAVIVLFKKVNKSIANIDEEVHDAKARKSGGGRGKLDLDDANLTINKMNKEDKSSRVSGGEIEKEEMRQQQRQQKQEMKALLRGEKVNNRNLMDNIFGNNSAGKKGGGIDWSNPFSIGHSAGNMFKEAMGDLMKFLKGDRQPVSSLGDGGGGFESPGGNGPTGGYDASSKIITLTNQDVEDLMKVTSTEVNHSLKSPEYEKQAGAVVDTILNRLAAKNQIFGKSLREIINKKNQFSKINGPKGYRDQNGKYHNLNPYGSVQAMPISAVNSRIKQFVPQYIMARAGGSPGYVNSDFNYLNPVHSGKKAMNTWGGEIVAQAKSTGQIFGTGNSRHYHGTPKAQLGSRPQGHRISFNGKTSSGGGGVQGNTTTTAAAAPVNTTTSTKTTTAPAKTTTTKKGATPPPNQVSKEYTDTTKRLEALRKQKLRLQKEEKEKIALDKKFKKGKNTGKVKSGDTWSPGNNSILGDLNRDRLDKAKYTLPELKDPSKAVQSDLSKYLEANKEKYAEIEKQKKELEAKLGKIVKINPGTVPVSTQKQSVQRVLINAGNPNPNLLGTVDESKLREAAKGTPWMEVAKNQIGVTDKGNPQIVLDYHKVAGVNGGVGTAWCGSFVSWCFDKAGINQFRSGRALDWLNFGKKLSKDNIPYGAVLIFKWSGGGQHVAFCAEDKGKQVVMLGGNQSARYNGKAARGVTKSTVGKSELVGVRFPENYSTNGLYGDGTNSTLIENAEGQKFQMNFDAIERIKKKQEERNKKTFKPYVRKEVTLGNRGAGTKAKAEASAAVVGKHIDAAVEKAAKEYNKDLHKVDIKIGDRSVVPFETYDPNTYTGPNKENPNAPIMEGLSVEENARLIKEHYEKIRLSEINTKVVNGEELTKEEQVLLTTKIKEQAKEAALQDDIKKITQKEHVSIENDTTGKTLEITENRKIVGKDGKVYTIAGKGGVASEDVTLPDGTVIKGSRIDMSGDVQLKDGSVIKATHVERTNAGDIVLPDGTIIKATHADTSDTGDVTLPDGTVIKGSMVDLGEVDANGNSVVKGGMEPKISEILRNYGKQDTPDTKTKDDEPTDKKEEKKSDSVWDNVREIIRAAGTGEPLTETEANNAVKDPEEPLSTAPASEDAGPTETSKGAVKGGVADKISEILRNYGKQDVEVKPEEVGQTPSTKVSNDSELKPSSLGESIKQILARARGEQVPETRETPTEDKEKEEKVDPIRELIRRQHAQEQDQVQVQGNRLEELVKEKKEEAEAAQRGMRADIDAYIESQRDDKKTEIEKTQEAFEKNEKLNQEKIEVAKEELKGQDAQRLKEEAVAREQQEQEVKAFEESRARTEARNQEQAVMQEKLRLAEIESERKRAEEQERQEIQALNDSEVFKRQLEVQTTMAKDLRRMIEIMEKSTNIKTKDNADLKVEKIEVKTPPAVVQTRHTTTVHKNEPVSMRIR